MTPAETIEQAIHRKVSRLRLIMMIVGDILESLFIDRILKKGK